MQLVAGIDIETTGLEYANGHRIIEVAAGLYDLQTGQHKGNWVQRINPQRPIDAKAQAVHGITFEEVANCQPFEAHAPTLARIMRGAVLLVAHNGEHFDFPFISHELTRVGVAVPDTPKLDTMLQGRWATPFGKSPNLGELCFACDVPYDPTQAHAAGYDVQVMMACFFKALRRGYYVLPQLKQAA